MTEQLVTPQEALHWVQTELGIRNPRAPIRWGYASSEVEWGGGLRLVVVDGLELFSFSRTRSGVKGHVARYKGSVHILSDLELLAIGLQAPEDPRG